MRPFPHIFNKYSLSFYCVTDAVLILGIQYGTKLDMILASKELTV